MSITRLVANAPLIGGSPQDIITSGALDCSGVDLLVVVYAWYAGGPTPVLTDSQSNSYSSIGAIGDGANIAIKLDYKVNPSVSGSMTFTAQNIGSYPRLAILGYSGAIGGLDGTQINSDTSAGATLQTGPVTPSVNGCVVVSGFADDNVGITFGIDSPFTIRASDLGTAGQNPNDIAIADDIQTTAASRNPTWQAGFHSAAMIAVFKPTVIVTGTPLFTTIGAQ